MCSGIYERSALIPVYLDIDTRKITEPLNIGPIQFIRAGRSESRHDLALKIKRLVLFHAGFTHRFIRCIARQPQLRRAPHILSNADLLRRHICLCARALSAGHINDHHIKMIINRKLGFIQFTRSRLNAPALHG